MDRNSIPATRPILLIAAACFHAEQTISPSPVVEMTPISSRLALRSCELVVEGSHNLGDPVIRMKPEFLFPNSPLSNCFFQRGKGFGSTDTAEAYLGSIWFPTVSWAIPNACYTEGIV